MNDTIQSGTQSIVTIGLSRTVSEINGDFHRKSPIFPIFFPMYFRPAEGIWNLVSAQGVEKAPMTGLPFGRKSFKIGLVV